MMNTPSIALATPLPTSPTRGEVPVGSLGSIVPNTPAHTSPLLGEAGRGVQDAQMPPTTLLYPRENF